MAEEPAAKPRRRPPARKRVARAAPKAAPAVEAVAAAAPAASPAEPEATRPKPPRVTVTSLEQSSTKLRTVMLNLAFVGAFLILVPVIASQFWQNDVVIEPISVPDSLVAVGMTPEVMAQRLWDGLQDAETRANTSKETVNAIPNSARIKFSIPETGVSIESLVSQTRQFFRAYQTRITGEFICGNADCRREEMRLRLRVVREAADVIDMPPVGMSSDRDYFAEAAIRVLNVLDPFVAVAARSEREPLQAVTLARQLIRQKHPDAKWAHNLIGSLYRSALEPALAVIEFRAALEIDPNFRIARGNLANALRESGEFDEARDLYRALGQSDPRDANVPFGLGELAIEDDRLDEGIDYLLSAAAMAPDDPYYLARAGQVEGERGNSDRAIELLRQALAIDPAFPFALGNLGMIYLQLGDAASAEPLFHDNAQLLPNDGDAQVLYGLALEVAGNVSAALENYERAVEIDPVNPTYLGSVARALTLLDRPEEAKPVLARLIASEPRNPEAFAELGRLEMLTGNNAEAERHYARAMELAPLDIDLMQSAATVQMMLGDFDDSVDLIQRALETQPDMVTLYFALGNYLKFGDRPTEATAAFQRFLDLTPPLPQLDEMRTMAQDAIDEIEAKAREAAAEGAP